MSPVLFLSVCNNPYVMAPFTSVNSFKRLSPGGTKVFFSVKIELNIFLALSSIQVSEVNLQRKQTLSFSRDITYKTFLP